MSGGWVLDGQPLHPAGPPRSWAKELAFTLKHTRRALKVRSDCV